MGLTNGDVAELTYFFTTPSAGAVPGEVLAAQRYEPRGSVTYDPYTDNRLAALVATAVSRRYDEAARVRRVLEHLVEQPEGRTHFDILRRAFRFVPEPSDEFRWPDVAAITPAALERGREIATKEEHALLLERTYDAARVEGCSPIATAMRVLDHDHHLVVYGVMVQDADVTSAALRALHYAVNPRDVAFLEAVKGQMHALVDAAGDAYRAARTELGETRRRAKAEARRANEDLLAQVLGKKRKKERERLERSHQARLRAEAKVA